jgi:hypothetical protein
MKQIGREEIVKEKTMEEIRKEGSNEDVNEPGCSFPHLPGDRSTPTNSCSRRSPPLVPCGHQVPSSCFNQVAQKILLLQKESSFSNR